MTDEITCGCGRKYVYDRRKGHTKTKCNSCMVNQRRFGVKLRAVAYKGGCCLLCGYSKCVEALCFHHLDPAQKEFTISGSHARAWAKIQKELDKCVLLCVRCHLEVHAGVATAPTP